MTQPTFSVVVPAFDEERFLPHCLDAIEAAAKRLGEPVEIVVVDNMSHDRTRDIALERAAKVIQVEEKCLSIIRNRGAAVATGRYLCFIDADSFMSDNMLVEVKKAMDSGRYVGGGVMNVRTDRSSLGINVSMMAACAAFLLTRMSLVMFYTTPDAFRAVGGFNENLYAIEDADFGRRLKRYGRKQGLRYKNLWSARVTTSARKFDEFGDWFIFRRPDKVFRALLNDRHIAHEIWYRRRR
ncbi:MAG: glycosyltransferase [FCB group bacterium]|nr:glycosyltransferase [FCB group bacterium]